MMQPYRAGPHWLIHADAFEAQHHFADWFGWPVDVVYSDLPWSEPALKNNYAWAGVGGGSAPAFSVFLPNLAFLYRRFCPRGFIVVEMGEANYDNLCSALSRASLQKLGEARTFYGARAKPAMLWIGSAMRTGTIEIPQGMYGPEVRPWLADTFGGPGRRVLDPCCGEMLSLLPFVDGGAHVFGVDIMGKKLRRSFPRFRARGYEVKPFLCRNQEGWDE